MNSGKKIEKPSGHELLQKHEYVAAAGSFFKDESKDSTRQVSIVTMEQKWL